MTTHQCSLSLECKSKTCTHAVPHLPKDCDCYAPCGNWPNKPDWKPSVCCKLVADVKPRNNCPHCGMIGEEGHHPGNCVYELKRRIAELQKWHPMATAPKNGQRILICRNDLVEPVTVGFWGMVECDWVAPLWYFDYKPVGWMPLPSSGENA